MSEWQYPALQGRDDSERRTREGFSPLASPKGFGEIRLSSAKTLKTIMQVKRETKITQAWTKPSWMGVAMPGEERSPW